ncbi:MAG: ABC transporter ATP-binding protein [bacterium]
MLRIAELSKTFISNGSAITALDKVSFTVFPGDKMLLYGPNGSGKTTLFKSICGLLIPDHGESRYGNQLLDYYEIALRKKISFIKSDINGMYPRLSLRDNLEFFTHPYIIDKKRRNDKINEFISVFGIESFGAMPFQNCSHGIKKRACLIKGLITDPEILLIDEWNSFIDAGMQESLVQYIHRTYTHKILIFSSHSISGQSDFFNKILILQSGRLMYADTIQNLIKKTNKGGLSEAVKDVTVTHV